MTNEDLNRSELKPDQIAYLLRSGEFTAEELAESVATGTRGGAWPDLHASQEARGLPIDQIVTRLRATIGVRLVAYIGGVGTTSAVAAWAEARDVPDADKVTRLRTAFHALGILLERWDPVTIESWFKGMNPDLGDESPARVIREAAPDGANEVLIAARSAMIN
ncbi:hypothetical protein [Leifsonia sp. NPDC058230]|uniref:hypothetical protein n=1 Tax=Leifsonia sp. NPDC058230 TaxID=3346391 RepID=UPI0036D7E779